MSSFFQPKSHSRKKDFEFGRILGVGGYGAVKLVTETKTSKEYAVKIVPKTTIRVSSEQQALRLEFLMSLEHPHVIKLQEYFESKERYYLLYELAAGGELYQRLIDQERLTEKETREVARSLLSALDYIHSRGIVHRDLKLENVLFRGSSFSDCCLADFGLAAILKEPEERLFTHCGSPGYAAPEIFLATAESYDSSVDLWSLGIILFCLLGGRFPYKAVDSLALAQEASTTRLHFPPHPWDSISNDVKHLISRLLTVDPLKRITAADALLHPWLESRKIETGSLTPPSEIAKDSSRASASASSTDQIERRPTKREVAVEGGGGAILGKRATTYIPFDPVIA